MVLPPLGPLLFHLLAILSATVSAVCPVLYTHSPATYSSVQFSRSVVSDCMQSREPQHARPPCPSPTPRVHPNPCPLSQWMPSSHLILCRPLLLLPSVFPNLHLSLKLPPSNCRHDTSTQINYKQLKTSFFLTHYRIYQLPSCMCLHTISEIDSTSEFLTSVLLVQLLAVSSQIPFSPSTLFITLLPDYSSFSLNHGTPLLKNLWCLPPA